MIDILDTDSEKQEWPMATFFMPEGYLKPSDFLEFSEKFYTEYGNLLPNYVGVVSQIGQPGDVPYQLKPPFDTLIFDARIRGSYLWQLSRGDGGLRTIWQLKGTDKYLIGKRFDLNNQGGLVGRDALNTEDINTVFQNIWSMLQSQETKAYIEEVAKNKTDTTASLEDFAVHRTMQVQHLIPVYKGRSVLQMLTIELQDSDYEREYEKRRLIVKGIGLTALLPYEYGKARGT